MNIDDIANIPPMVNAADQSSGQSHVSLFYDSSEQRLRFLANYIQVGLACGELCILVTSRTQAAAEARLLSMGLDIQQALRRGDVRIFNAREAYLTNSLFVVEYMRANVENLLSDAKAQGYRGIRTVGELSWLAGRETVSDNEPLLGLCLYPIDDASLTDIKNTVPDDSGIIYAEQAQHEPYSMHIKSRWTSNLEPSEVDRSNLKQSFELSNQAIKKLLLRAGTN
ncbi:MAG: hypothetical protein JWL89_134 [Candidatus Saccharibacteria bacterium]|jgi:hypothetical protein|nr:hypothetical protein [Candidatus Saccharibacteria bacterium]